MLSIIHGLLFHHRHWRDIEMSELSELYLSNTLKTFAISLIGIFVPVYLYDLGYSLQSILWFHGVFLIGRVVFDLCSGFLVSRFGPKHVMRASYLITLISLSMMVTLEQTAWPLWSIAIIMASGWSFYWLSYHVDFSKIKHTDHEGKELSNMTVLVRIASVLGPLGGGALAYFTSIQFVFLTAVAMMFTATIPLMLTPEPVKTRTNLKLFKSKFLHIKRDFVTVYGAGADQVSAVMIWPLFISLSIFTFNDAVYAKVGFVASISMVSGLLMIKAMGRIVDSNRGRELMRYSTMAASMVHAIRPFISTSVGVVVVNIFNEPAYNGMRISLAKGAYDRADGFDEDRVSYLTWWQVTTSIGKGTIVFVMIASSYHFSDIVTLQIGFLTTAFLTSFALFEKYPALERRR